MVVRELITRLGFKTDDAQLKKAEQGIDRLKNQANGLSLSFQNIFRGFLGFQAVKSIVQIGDDMQSMRTRIGMLPQTLGDAGDALDNVAKRANATRQSLLEYGSFYVKAGNATQDFIHDQETLMKVVDGAALGLAASGATATAQKQAFFQLGQAIGSPTVQMEEMNTLIDVAPDLFRELGKVIPGANGQLKKFISTGSVTGKMLAEGLIKVMPQFEAKMRSMPLTVGVATTLVANKWSLMIDKINRKTLFITKIASLILGGLDKIEQGIEWLSEKFGGAGNLIQFTLIAIATAITAILAPALATLAVAISVAIWPFTLMTAAILALTVIIEDLYVWIAGGDSVIGKFVGSWEDASNAIVESWTGLKNWFDDLFSWFSDKFGMVNGWVNNLLVGAQKIGSALGFGNPSTSIPNNAIAPLTPSVTPAALQGVGGGASSNNTINKNTTVNLTVPAGTSQEQAKFLQNSAQKAFAVDNSNMTRDIAMVSQ